MMKNWVTILAIVMISTLCLAIWYKVFDVLLSENVKPATINVEEEMKEAIYKGDVEKVKSLLADDYDINHQNEQGETALHTAAIFEQPAIAALLLDSGADATIKDQSGDTPIHFAVRFGEFDIIKAIHDHEFDLNSQNNDGETPMLQMFDAFDTTNQDLINMYDILVEKGADPTIEDQLGFTVLTHANLSNKVEFIEYLKSLNLPGDIEGRSEANNVLEKLNLLHKEEFLQAIYQENYGLVNVFLQAGYTPDIRGTTNLPIVIDLAFSDSNQMIALLLSNGVDPDTPDDAGNTALIRASIRDNPELVGILLENGAIDKKNNAGYTARMIAEEDGHEEIVNLLKKNKGDHQSITIEESVPSTPIKKAPPIAVEPTPPNGEIILPEELEMLGDDRPEFRIMSNDQEVGYFYTEDEAIAYAQTLENAEVYFPNMIVWDNIPSDLYVDNQFMEHFPTENEAIQSGMKYENAKVVAQYKNKVIWDSYPKECGTCESPIMAQYE